MKKPLPHTKVWKQMTVNPDDLAISCQKATDEGWCLELGMTSASGAMAILVFSRWSNEPLNVTDPMLPLDADEEVAAQ